ncbi:MAG TPA: alpha/beta hydrolase family protein [Sphaerochaeta sp.]|nr:alpha/beta hydrolase family protein [Sphaerochaeta sp.]
MELLGSLSRYISQQLDNRKVDSIKKEEFRKTLAAALLMPAFEKPTVTSLWVKEHDELRIEKLTWNVGFGCSEGYLLSPSGAKEKLPGILALHDHAGEKYWGKSKITDIGEKLDRSLVEHQKRYYGARAWANELAKRGYAVFVPDLFGFESRRIKVRELPESLIQGLLTPPLEIVEGGAYWNDDLVLDDSLDSRVAYNALARGLEHVIAKVLMSGGYTWAGYTAAEDLVALDILSEHELVDSSRLGCGGLSLGGLRSVLLSSLSPKIQASFVTGFMTTFKDLVNAKAANHTWIAYAPRLSHLGEFGDLLMAHAPKPLLVQHGKRDSLFTFSEVERSALRIGEHYKDDSEQFVFTVYDEPHLFNEPMQEEAFAFFDHFFFL